MPVTLPAGFTIDTQLSPDRVRVQWPATATPGTSTLPNLGFESGDASYIKGAGWAITSAAPVDVGTWSAKYTGIGQSNIVHETLAPVTAGTSITASARISKGNNRQDFAGGAVVLQWFDNTLASLGFNVGNVVNTGTSAFQTSSVTANAPTGAAYVRLAASATRDVKGRATDAVTVDTLTWNHVFTLGGTSETGGTAPTGPVALTFRVTDSNGCQAVATRTIGEAPLSNGTWILFGRPQGSTAADQYSVSSIVPSGFTGAKRSAVVSGVGFNLDISGAGGGWLYAAPRGGSVIRSNNLGATWASTAFSSTSVQQRIDVRSGRVFVSQPSVLMRSDDNGTSVTNLATSAWQERYFFGASSGVGSARGGSDLIQTTDNGTTQSFVAGFPTWGRNAVNLCAGTTHLVMAGASNSPTNRFSRVPIGTPLAAHTPFTVAAVSSTASWNFVSPSIAYGNSIFVMVTDQGQIVRSTDEGATWTVSSFTFPSPRSLVFGDGVFMIVGDAGAIYTSTNGDTWTQVPSGSFGTDNITNAIFVPN